MPTAVYVQAEKTFQMNCRKLRYRKKNSGISGYNRIFEQHAISEAH